VSELGSFGVKIGGTGGDRRYQERGGRAGLEVAETAQPHPQAEVLRGGEQAGRARGVADDHVGGPHAKFTDGGQRRARRRPGAEDGDGGGGGHPGFGESVHDPADVGVVAAAAFGAVHHGVGAAGRDRQRVRAVEQGQHRALERHRERQARPLGAARRHVLLERGFVALHGRIRPVAETERVVGRTVQHRGQGVGDRLAQDGGSHGLGQLSPVGCVRQNTDVPFG
jgi:hypothetical protein